MRARVELRQHLQSEGDMAPLGRLVGKFIGDQSVTTTTSATGDEKRADRESEGGLHNSVSVNV